MTKCSAPSQHVLLCARMSKRSAVRQVGARPHCFTQISQQGRLTITFPNLKLTCTSARDPGSGGRSIIQPCLTACPSHCFSQPTLRQTRECKGQVFTRAWCCMFEAHPVDNAPIGSKSALFCRGEGDQEDRRPRKRLGSSRALQADCPVSLRIGRCRMLLGFMHLMAGTCTKELKPLSC